VGWGQPKYNVFFQRRGKCRAKKYNFFWHRLDVKTRKANYNTFAMYFEEIQEKVVEKFEFFLVFPPIETILSFPRNF
jgi:uncharacterized protein YjaG (DUF416 family)